MLTHQRQFMLDQGMSNEMDVIGLHGIDPRS
jgi:hypothetical protein